MSDVTRPCVLMLKFERTIRHIIKFPFIKIYNIILKICKYINWCVIRSFMRVFGIPLTLYSFKLMIDLFGKYGWNDKFSTIDSVLCMLDIITMVILLVVTMYSWMEIPDKEREILES